VYEVFETYGILVIILLQIYCWVWQ